MVAYGDSHFRVVESFEMSKKERGESIVEPSEAAVEMI